MLIKFLKHTRKGLLLPKEVDRVCLCYLNGLPHLWHLLGLGWLKKNINTFSLRALCVWWQGSLYKLRPLHIRWNVTGSLFSDKGLIIFVFLAIFTVYFLNFQHLPVIQCATIVRCRACRTYINPFVYFVDAKRWKCNLCYRVNDCEYCWVI